MTRTPQETPAGVGTCCRSTCQPSAVSRDSTQAAASAYSGEVPGRGPIRPANFPAFDDNSSITRVSGSSELPAASGLKPVTRCS